MDAYFSRGRACGIILLLGSKIESSNYYFFLLVDDNYSFFLFCIIISFRRVVRERPLNRTFNVTSNEIQSSLVNTERFPEKILLLLLL